MSALTQMSGEWVVIRWHARPDGTRFRCGPLSRMRAFDDWGGYGFPNRGHIGVLALFESQADAQRRIDAGEFEAGPKTEHTVESLGSLRFVVEGGPMQIGSRLFRVEGRYAECVQACGLATIGGVERLEIRETVQGLASAEDGDS